MTELLLKNKTLLMLCKKLCPVTHVGSFRWPTSALNDDVYI